MPEKGSLQEISITALASFLLRKKERNSRGKRHSANSVQRRPKRHGVWVTRKATALLRNCPENEQPEAGLASA